MKRKLHSPGMVPRQIPAIVTGVCLLLSGCASQKGESPGEPKDATQLKKTVSKIRDGELVDSLNKKNPQTNPTKKKRGKNPKDAQQPENNPDLGQLDEQGNPVGAADLGGGKPAAPVNAGAGAGAGAGAVPAAAQDPAAGAPGLAQKDAAPPVPDPCPQVASPKAGSPDDVMQAALKDLAKCLMDVYHPAEVMSTVISHLTVMKVTLPVGTKPFAEQTVEELEEFVKSAQKRRDTLRSQLGEGFQFRDELRTSYSDDELQDIVSLVRRRTNRLRDVEKKVFAAVDARLDLIQ
ncbi:MAG: hypothetical protein HYX41_04445, partial [Bdellovibrio sp.]|nr:hypothetical protein [Bdellovibrio sp.]